MVTPESSNESWLASAGISRGLIEARKQAEAEHHDPPASAGISRGLIEAGYRSGIRERLRVGLPAGISRGLIEARATGIPQSAAARGFRGDLPRPH